MRSVLNTLVDEFHERALPDLVTREQRLDRVPGKVNVIAGMRRSGKTWFCYQDMQALLADGIPKERLLYVNFEDDRLLPFGAGDFQEILDTYYRKFPPLKDESCYFYLDEPQRIEGWELFVRRVLDTERIALCVTGSSSRLLSTEIATALRGRSLLTEIFPFSFREFLKYHRPEFASPSRFGSRTRAAVQQALDHYRAIGGFPEVQTVTDDLRRQILRNYLDVAMLRDIVERFEVSNTVALRTLIRAVLSAPATRFSVNKFYNTLRSQGIACTKNDLYDFMQYLADVYLVYRVPLWSRSEKARQVNPQKVYVIDPGLLEATSLDLTEDRGAILENVVYMHLRRGGHEMGYYISRDGFEVDFVASRGGRRKPDLIQVCWSMADEATRDREMRGLLAAMKELRISRGTIVTWLDEDLSNEQVAIVPAWKWLLE